MTRASEFTSISRSTPVRSIRRRKELRQFAHSAVDSLIDSLPITSDVWAHSHTLGHSAPVTIQAGQPFPLPDIDLLAVFIDDSVEDNQLLQRYSGRLAGKRRRFDYRGASHQFAGHDDRIAAHAARIAAEEAQHDEPVEVDREIFGELEEYFESRNRGRAGRYDAGEERE